MPGCKCCLSPYLDFINDLLLRGRKMREVSQLLRETHSVSISHSSIWRHYRNHLLPSLQRAPTILEKLNELGQWRLAKAIIKGSKILNTRPKCTCLNPTSFRRRGVAYLCNICGGWVRADLARAIMRMQKGERRGTERLSRVIVPTRR